MGCSASKLDNEDTVRRCKDRRRLMKEAVYSRHHLAAAHSDYCRSLRATGSALSDFASNEPLSVSDSTPAVLLRNSSSFSSKSFPLPSKSFSLPSQPPPIRTASSPAPSSVHPPPPPPPYSPSLSSSSTMASSKIPHILSGSSVKSTGNVSRGSGRRRQTDHHSQQPQQQQPPLPPPQLKPLKPKLPHILSDSSISSTPTGTRHAENFGGYDATYAAYPATPSSQASSVWNWEHFYPPSPPESEFFYTHHQQQQRHQPYQNDAVYYPKKNPHHHDDEIHHLDVESEEERETEREEVHCSEWGDHYSTSTSTTSESEADGDDERETARSEVSEIRSNFGSSTRNGSSIGQQQQQRRNQNHHQPPTSAKYNGGGMDRVDEKSDDGGGSSSVSWGYGAVGSGGGEVSDMRVVVRHRDLKEIVASIKEYFDKAASAGDQVGEMLETGRAQLDRSFRQLKKTVYHSSGVLSSLSSTWSSKPPLAVKYSLDPGSLDQPGSSKSLCSTLERLLAWEKKLYEEVKARESVRIAHEKKLKTLQSQEYKGENEVKVDKTKSSIKRLQSLIIVTSQAVNTTSSAIVGLRDSDLVPQLVELCHGLMYMWRAMNQSHEFQNQVVQQVRGLVNQSMKGHSTSELHRQATRDLESAVSAWHSSFCRLVQHQREFICSLQSWFKLSLQPVDSEVASLNMVAARSTEAFSFFDEWKLSLDRLPDKVASEAIKSFVNVVHVISSKQAEEIKTKRKTETVSKELEKKASSVRNIERKYYHSYSTVGLGLPDKGDDGSGLGLDARDPLAEKKAELASYQRKVEDEMLKHAKAVEVTRAMTLNNLQTGLPGVFQAMTSFSSLYAESMETVCTRSYAIK